MVAGSIGEHLQQHAGENNETKRNEHCYIIVSQANDRRQAINTRSALSLSEEKKCGETLHCHRAGSAPPPFSSPP